jgi:hypothetical protein
MHDDAGPREKPDDDYRRTEEARRVVEDYANGLREMMQKLRRWFS